ncbi:amino acid adenylation domain-containing protein [Streptomyces sp. NPDC008313]|uniref:amino acid adenylation domain-containing protein n=1 Tax=Streptomyces sp. NPDC008313 TaxID=3364826 RepID=UPI0036EF2DC4
MTQLPPTSDTAVTPTGTATPSTGTGTGTGTALSIAHGPAAEPTAVLARFEDWARRTPQAPAVIDGARTWTYQDLDTAAARVAAALGDRVRPGDLVGVCLDRSTALVVTAVALARIGAVYLPLGPRPGERRTQAVTEDLDVVCLIGDPDALPGSHRTGEAAPLPLPTDGVNAPAAAVAAFTAGGRGTRRAPEGALYAVLTSGSTGRPKAVAVAEASLSVALDWYRAETGLAPGDRQSLVIGVAFDPHLLELWAALTSGAALVPAPDDTRWDSRLLTDWWRDAAVTVAVAATPTVEPLLDQPWPEDLKLRHLIVGGDRMRRHPGPDVTATVHNAYGPAEATVVTTTHAMRGADARAGELSPPPIGTPLPGVTIVVTGEDGRPVARGQDGELRVGGHCLALGYLDPELTAHRFTAPPEHPALSSADRLYRTGDRVRMNADGSLEFLGRLDDQVKISGVRIEPAEVEAAFEQDPRVRSAVVTVARDDSGHARLAAHVRLADGAGPTARDLLAAVRAWLPEQAVPATVRVVDGYPLDANGKVDRAALAARASGPASAATTTDDLAGATPTERLVLTAVRDLLGRPGIVLDDNFVDAGGTSVVAARLLVTVERETGVRPRAHELLRSTDLRAFAALLDQRRPHDPQEPGTAPTTPRSAAPADRAPAAPAGDRTTAPVTPPAPTSASAPASASAKAVTALVARHAELTPDALAVVDGDTTLTYGRLVQAGRALAARLRDHQVGRGDRVALLTTRSARTVVAQLALWWAGAVCVPLDPAQPRPRTEAMIADADVTLTLGDAKLLEAAGLAGPVLALPEEPLTDGGFVDDADPDSPAFIMFTSGSTGRPKGVVVPHAAVAELVTAPDYVTVTARDRILFHSPMTFDASTFEVWGALANGAAVVVCTVQRPSLEDLARHVERHGVTVAFLTTALFHQLASRRSRLFAQLRSVLVGGEALGAAQAREVLTAFPWLELVNVYGPTEATTFATAHRVTERDCDAPIPIGRPIAGATVHVLDADGAPVPDGDRGELWIGGSRLAHGYTGRPDLTAERFVEHPAAGRLYRTGDIVSFRPDGGLEFHGRNDDQVKVRGFRIEPAEVEHALRQEPGVDDAAVTADRAGTPDARLVAFVVAAPGPVPPARALRERLTAVLPAHLVPDAVTMVERLPLTPSGKVDRRALAGLAREAGDDADAAPAAEMTPLEQAVAEVWSRALGSDVTRADADFLALGGHSLLALAVTDDLREDLGVELALADFFAAPTVAAQAALVERALLTTDSDLHPETPEHSDVH